MQGVAQLQMGRVGQARATFVRVLSLFGAARKLGNKVISAGETGEEGMALKPSAALSTRLLLFPCLRLRLPEQYALRRAAEYVALTLPPDGAAADDAETEALVAPLRLGPRLRVPAAVEPGSAAHAACLAFPAPLLGLEAGYFFNASRQMDPVALVSALGQVDAVLDVIAGVSAFDAATAMAAPRAGAAPGARTAWRDAAVDCPGPAPPAAPERSPADLRAAFDAAARAVPRGMPEGGGGGRGGGVMGRMFGGGGASTLPAYARPQPLLSVQAVAVAALVRGSLSAALGRADEAAAAYAWVTEVAAEGGEAAAAISRREVQTVAYSHYERAVLYADGAKALARRAAAARSPAAAAAVARRVPLVLPCDLVGDVVRLGYIKSL